MSNRAMREGRDYVGVAESTVVEGLLDELLRRINNVSSTINAAVLETDDVINTTWGGSDSIHADEVASAKDSNVTSSTPPMEYRLRQAISYLEIQAERVNVNAAEIKRRI